LVVWFGQNGPLESPYRPNGMSIGKAKHAALEHSHQLYTERSKQEIRSAGLLEWGLDYDLWHHR
jgi:hypothetical protein